MKPRRVPLTRCRRCTHFRRESCTLLDLDPCRFVPTDPDNERAIESFLIAVTTICICVILLCIFFTYNIF